MEVNAPSVSWSPTTNDTIAEYAWSNRLLLVTMRRTQAEAGSATD
jgi:hypothetical protein